MAERTFTVLEGGEVDDGLGQLTKNELLDRLRAVKAKNDGLRHDLALAEEGMRELRASRAAYKARLTRLTRGDPQADLIEGLLVYWKLACHGPTSRVEIPVEGKRGDAVRRTVKRLVDSDPDPELANPDEEAQKEAVSAATDRAVEHIKLAIDGAARLPFEGKYGIRFAEDGKGRKRKVDIVYVCRDEIKLEQFVALVDSEPKRLAYRATLAERLQSEPNLKLVLASLFMDGECHGEILARAVRYCASL